VATGFSKQRRHRELHGKRKSQEQKTKGWKARKSSNNILTLKGTRGKWTEVNQKESICRARGRLSGQKHAI